MRAFLILIILMTALFFNSQRAKNESIISNLKIENELQVEGSKKSSRGPASIPDQKAMYLEVSQAYDKIEKFRENSEGFPTNSEVVSNSDDEYIKKHTVALNKIGDFSSTSPATRLYKSQIIIEKYLAEKEISKLSDLRDSDIQNLNQTIQSLGVVMSVDTQGDLQVEALNVINKFPAYEESSLSEEFLKIKTQNDLLNSNLTSELQQHLTTSSAFQHIGE